MSFLTSQLSDVVGTSRAGAAADCCLCCFHASSLDQRTDCCVYPHMRLHHLSCWPTTRGTARHGACKSLPVHVRRVTPCGAWLISWPKLDWRIRLLAAALDCSTCLGTPRLLPDPFAVIDTRFVHFALHDARCRRPAERAEQGRMWVRRCGRPGRWRPRHRFTAHSTMRRNSCSVDISRGASASAARIMYGVSPSQSPSTQASPTRRALSAGAHGSGRSMSR